MLEGISDRVKVPAARTGQAQRASPNVHRTALRQTAGSSVPSSWR